MSSRAPIGYVAIAEVPVAMNQGFIAMICDKEVPKEFVWLWLHENMETIIGRANGTTFLEISKANFRSIPLTVPPVSVLEDFRDRVVPLWNLFASNERESQALAATRDLLLPHLLNGHA
jgi:type I restriction enzyme S subunit